MKKQKTKKNNNKKTKKNNKKNNKKTIKKLNCSPNKKLDFTCYSPKSLIKLRNKWNLENKDKQIKSNDLYIIWNTLNKYLQDTCSNEHCWLSKEFISNDLDSTLSKNTFAPFAPPTWKKNPNEWLSSVDINKVMHQYENKYKNFKFIGPSPIDFDKKKTFSQCVWNDLCHFSIKKYKDEGINKIGIIFNTDPHHLSGSHWICLFINLENKFIYYFDSNADTIPKEVNKLIRKIKRQAKSLNIDLKEIINKTTHQRSNTECGMYVLYIIISLLKNKECPNFTDRIPDKEMEKLRKIFFN